MKRLSVNIVCEWSDVSCDDCMVCAMCHVSS